MQQLLFRLFRGMLLRTMGMRLTQLELLPLPPRRVLFLGDSITEQGAWAEWFPELPVINRGVGSDTIAGVLARLDHAINDPLAISLLIGTNDLGGLGRSKKVPDIAAQMEELVAAIRATGPDASLLITSVLPRVRSLGDEVQALNVEYRRIAAAAGATYVDAWPLLAEGQGAIRKDRTGDDLHLNGSAYLAWTDLLRPQLTAAVAARGN